MFKKLAIIVLVMLNIGCDQLSKDMVRKYVAPRDYIPLVEDNLILTNVENTGAMVYNGLEVLSHNLNRKKQHLKFFEFGKTYHGTEETFLEASHLSLFVTGNRNPDHWKAPAQPTDFFYVKSIVENILLRLGISGLVPAPANNDLIAEGIALKREEKEVVVLGILKKSSLQPFDIKQEVLFADFNWNLVVRLMQKVDITFQEVPKYPEVKRDFALLLDNRVTFDQVYRLGIKTERKLLKHMVSSSAPFVAE